MNEADKFLQEHLAKAQREAQANTAPRSTIHLRPSTGVNPSHSVNARIQQPQATPSSAYNRPSASPVSYQGEQYMVSMFEAFKRFWTNWSFTGRSSRSEYWFATLANAILNFIILFCAALVFPKSVEGLDNIIALLTLWPSIAISVRRLHDIGKSGWFFLLLFIPIVGVCIFLVFDCRASQPHENEYGPVPNVR